MVLKSEKYVEKVGDNNDEQKEFIRNQNTQKQNNCCFDLNETCSDGINEMNNCTFTVFSAYVMIHKEALS